MRDAQRGDDNAAIEWARICEQMRKSLVRGLHAFGFENGHRSRTGKRLDQGLCGLLVLRVGAQTGRIGRGVLDLLRQWSDEDRTFDRYDFTDLVQAKLGFATGNKLGDITALLELCLWPDLVGDAKAFEQFIDIDPARAAARGSI